MVKKNKKTFLKKIKEILLSERSELLKHSYPHDIDVDGDETDQIQARLLINLHDKLIARNNAKILQIDIAIKNIEDKSYGSCEDCGEFIPEKRLLINPLFKTCVACAEDREAENKQRKRL